MTIILPEGTGRAWAAAHLANRAALWSALAQNLLLEAEAEHDAGVRSDILTLALVACQHGLDRLASLDRRLRSVPCVGLALTPAIDQAHTRLEGEIKAQLRHDEDAPC